MPDNRRRATGRGVAGERVMSANALKEPKGPEVHGASPWATSSSWSLHKEDSLCFLQRAKEAAGRTFPSQDTPCLAFQPPYENTMVRCQKTLHLTQGSFHRPCSSSRWREAWLGRENLPSLALLQGLPSRAEFFRKRSSQALQGAAYSEHTLLELPFVTTLYNQSLNSHCSWSLFKHSSFPNLEIVIRHMNIYKILAVFHELR